MSACQSHGDSTPTQHGAAKVYITSHTNEQYAPCVCISAGTDVRTTIDLSAEGARALAKALTEAAGTVEAYLLQQDERRANALLERGHLLADQGLPR